MEENGREWKRMEERSRWSKLKQIVSNCIKLSEKSIMLYVLALFGWAGKPFVFLFASTSCTACLTSQVHL